MCDDDDDYEISHGPVEAIGQYKTVMELTGCTDTQAIFAIVKAKGDIVEAIDMLLKKPPTQGDKFLPKKPVVDTGLSEEQKALCERGRWLQDRVNVVFSVAHSQTRTQPDAEALVDAVPPAVQSPHPETAQQPPTTSELEQDSPSKTTLLSPQSEMLP